MKLSGLLFKAGVVSVGAGIYLYFKKLFKSKKNTKKEPAKNLKRSKAVKKVPAKPRQKRSPAIQG